MTENKRFTMCHEQNDMNGWTMGIVDWQTKEPFNYTTYEVHSSSITDTKDEMEDMCLLLNELHDENQELKKKNKQLSIDFIDFKMKLIEQLHIHYDYASEQRQKYLNYPFIVKAYDIIRCDVRKLAEEMGVDLE